jgi:tetratricopeptide (TPR) repeat protein
VIGLAYERLGEFDAALTAFEETLKSRKQILGMEHTDTLRSLYGLASAYYGLGRYGTATKLFGETLKAREKVLEIDHPDIICTINKLEQSQRMLQQTFESPIN